MGQMLACIGYVDQGSGRIVMCLYGSNLNHLRDFVDGCDQKKNMPEWIISKCRFLIFGVLKRVDFLLQHEMKQLDLIGPTLAGSLKELA